MSVQVKTLQAFGNGYLVSGSAARYSLNHASSLADTYSLQEESLLKGLEGLGELRHPPTPPPRKHTSGSVLKSSGQQPPDRLPSVEEPPRSSLLLELDVNIHVDSGRCGLHPRLPKQEGGGVTSLGGRSLWPTSPAIGCPSSPQDDLYKAYLNRYKRQLSQDPLLKPTDVSVFYLPALDVGVSCKFVY